MKRYFAFLRGVNVGGKNRVPMAECRQALERLGFCGAVSYLNSGNLRFSSDEEDRERIACRIETMLTNRFDLTIPVYVIEEQALGEILRNAPAWWGSGDKEIYDNLIFLLPPVSFAEVLDALGEPREGLERIKHCGEAIFWSFSRKDYQKTSWWPGTAKAGIRDKLTIRTANTVRKLMQL